MRFLAPRFTATLLVGACTVAFSGVCHGAFELVFSDSFDIGTNMDINADLASRQSGTAATSTYTDLDSAAGWGAVAEIYDNALWLTAPYVSGQPDPHLKARATVALDANLSMLSGNTSTIDAFLSLDDVGGDNWAAITLDGTKDSDLPGTSNVSFVVRPDTTYDLWVNGSKIIDENDSNHGLFTGLEHNIQFRFNDHPENRYFDLTVDGTSIIAAQRYQMTDERYLMLQSFALGAEGGVDVSHVFDNIQIQMQEGAEGPAEPGDPVQIAHWTFDADLTDSVGAHDGTAFGGAAITTAPGERQVGNGALKLDKSQSQYVTVDSLSGELATGDPTTITMWFNTTRQGADMVHHGDNVFFSAHSAGGVTNLFRSGTGTNGGVYLNPTDIGGPEPDEENGAGFNDGQWHFLAITLESDGTTTVYVDEDGEGNLQEIPGFTDRPGQPKWSLASLFSFGQEWDGATPTNFYDGLVDDVQLWKGQLPLEDLQAIYDASAGGQDLPGDLNSDGFVGGDDLDIVRSFWGQTVTAGDLLSGDPSEDGFVGGDDLDIVRANWGQGTPPAPAAVPEPASWIMLIAGGLGLLCYSRKR